MNGSEERFGNWTDLEPTDAQIAEYYASVECTCHHEPTEKTHELCCGYANGRNPDCPRHGDRPA